MSEWLRPEDIGRAGRLISLCRETLEETEANLASENPHLDVQMLLKTLLLNTERLAVAIWVAEKDIVQAQTYLKLTAETGLRLLSVRDRSRTWYLSSLGERSVERQANGEITVSDVVEDSDFKSTGQQLADRLDGEYLPSKNAVAYVDDSLVGATTVVSALQAALAIGDMSLARRIAELSTSPSDFKWDDDALCWYARVLKYMILESDEPAKESLDSLLAIAKNPLKQIAYCYSAVLRNDDRKARKELGKYIKWFYAHAKPVYSKTWGITRGWLEQWLMPEEYLLSIQGIALCNFATTRGIKVEVDEPFLPGAFLRY